MRAVVAGDHADDAFQRACLRHVEPNDFAVTHRAAKNAPDESVAA